MKKVFNALLVASCGYAIFVAASGFLFGQVFFWNFDVPATTAGVFGVLAGSLGLVQRKTHLVPNIVIILCSVASLAGVGMDAYGYYSNYHSPGNSYAWFMIGPYCVALVLIACLSRKSRQQCDQSTPPDGE